VALTATPAAGFTFTGWSGGGCTGTSPCTVTLGADATVTATLVPLYTLTVNLNGAGSVTSAPVGIACGATCSALFASGTAVALTATPAAGFTFTGWSGGGCTGTSPCTVTLGANTTVTATFVPLYTLTVNLNGAGSVTSAPVGIACGATCSALFASGTAVALTATPTAGFAFTGWSGGGCSGTGTCTVTLNGASTVTATFVPLYTLTVNLNPASSGTVTSVPAGIA